MTFRKLTAALLTTAFAVPVTAAAAPGAFFGVSLVNSNVDISASDVDDGSFTSARADDSASGFRVHGGYMFNDNVGFEAAYIDAGTVSVNAVSDGSSFLYAAGPVEDSFDISGVTFGLDVCAPFSEQIYGIGRFGMLMWTIDTTVRMSGFSGSASDDGNDPYIGLGVGFRAGQTGIELGWTRYSVEDSDADALMLGVVFRPRPH